MEKVYYHVVTERPMELGQIIVFDENNQSGVYKRVNALKEKVEDIYKNPEKYKDTALGHHTKVALRELALEEIRKAYYPEYPSRLEALYVTDTPDEAKNWYYYFKDLGREVFGIVKVKTNGQVFTGNANKCFEGTIDREKNLELAKEYWKGVEDNSMYDPVLETIITGPIEVIEIVKERKENAWKSI